MDNRKIKSVTVKVAGKTATRETGHRALRTAFEAFCGVLFAGIADVFLQDYTTPAFRSALFCLIAMAVSTAVTAFLNEDQKLKRSTRTFVQVFIASIAGGLATVIGDYGTPAFRTGILGLIIVALSTALAAVMNLQSPGVMPKGVPDGKDGGDNA